MSTRSGRVSGFVARLTLDLRVPQPKVSRRQPVVADNVEDPALTQTLKKALSCVTSAKKVYLRGAAVSADARSALSPSLTRVVLDFVSRSNTLHTMFIVNMELPLYDICIAATKELTFFWVKVVTISPPPLLLHPYPRRILAPWMSSELRRCKSCCSRLSSSSRCVASAAHVLPRQSRKSTRSPRGPRRIYELLLTPLLAPFASNLRRLTVFTHGDYASNLWFLCAPFLAEDHICGVVTSSLHYRLQQPRTRACRRASASFAPIRAASANPVLPESPHPNAHHLGGS
ncbi:hypothetical protein MKEN_01314500 [Mycena kentingensis (nom. inval.)]|nr:hypothetical protein MKEN_01314500 [Mycena kentingensis (nom. inval.)]